MPTDWKCPYCNRHTTITERDISGQAHDLAIKNSEGHMRLHTLFIVCPNPNCKRVEATAIRTELIIGQDQLYNETRKEGKLLERYPLMPRSRAQTLPEYIPAPIRADYAEACLISDLSPKASATLSRRCIQGILRDFWAVKPGRLVDEISQIQSKIDPLTWDAIEAVRKVGNIGAHMEADINVIVDVEPNEAALLTGLIETLIEEWYINREERKKKLTAITALATQKNEDKKKKG